MTGNITVHAAVWAEICGNIEFSLNFQPYGRYVLHIGGGITIEEVGKDQRPRSITREEVLTLIQQGDDAMWTWATFLSMWQGWADGWAKCKRQLEKQCQQEQAKGGE